MSVYGVKLPDVGEGVAEAELITWHVAVGDHVHAESVLAEVLTDKATVEVASPVTGVVTFLHGSPGDSIAVGTEFVGIELESNSGGEEPAPADPPPVEFTEQEPAPPPPPPPPSPPQQSAAVDEREPRPSATGRALAAPAVRARAATLGIDLGTIPGSGPDGRVLHSDLDQHLAGTAPRRAAATTTTASSSVEPVLGLRRRIADRLTAAWTEIPHITYVDAVDATALEALRSELNRPARADGLRLTILPFLARAMVIACLEQPRVNAHYDAAASSLSVSPAVHIGIATQTPDGLKVPVLRNAEARDLWETAAEIGRISAAARDGSATREELSGSTITITSLGALGGLVTTPIINQPEVAIIGVNKLEQRPVWIDGAFQPRMMFNLSSSFDHRIVDGWDAATFIQRIKALLEMPALLFVGDR